MSQEELEKLKEDDNVKFIYKIPNSSYEEKFEYVIVGDLDKYKDDNVRTFTCDEWFYRINSGSLLPYVCATLNRKDRVKEYLNLYQKPDLLKLRIFILHSTDPKEIQQESL